MKYQDRLTVGKLKEIIEQLPDDMLVCVDSLGSYFPAFDADLGEFIVYEYGDPVGKQKCVKIK